MKNEKTIKPEKDIVALTEEPAGGITVQDVRLWLSYHTSENKLADALALVSNQVGWIADEVDDYEEGTVAYNHALAIYTEWQELDCELTNRVLSLSKTYPEINEQIDWGEKVGTYYQVLPFMRIYGYSDKNGWLIKDEETE